METLALSAGPYSVIATADGGGLLVFSRQDASGLRHILRPAADIPSSHLDRAMIVMTPWCNRIGGEGFPSGGRFHPLAPNVPGFPMPLHGAAFQSQWALIAHSKSRLILALDANGPGPFQYQALLAYTLSLRQLRVDLSVTNTGAEDLPFGIGLHPWFACDAETRLQFAAQNQVMSDATGLPSHVGPLMDDYGKPRGLPSGRIDNTFTGWDGTARLSGRGSTICLRSNAPMLHVYSPQASANFCCLEPSTALPNAPNFAPGPILTSGATMSIRAAISCENAAA